MPLVRLECGSKKSSILGGRPHPSPPDGGATFPIKVGQKPDEQERLLADRPAKPEADVRELQAVPGEGKESSLCWSVEKAAEGGGRLRRREGVSVSERPSQEPVGQGGRQRRRALRTPPYRKREAYGSS